MVFATRAGKKIKGQLLISNSIGKCIQAHFYSIDDSDTELVAITPLICSAAFPKMAPKKCNQALVSQTLVIEMCETVPFIRIDIILHSTTHPAHTLHHPVGLCSGYPNVIGSLMNLQGNPDPVNVIKRRQCLIPHQVITRIKAEFSKQMALQVPRPAVNKSGQFCETEKIHSCTEYVRVLRYQ